MGERAVQVEGRCAGSKAYRLGSPEPLGVDTRQLLPSGLPPDFSVKAMLRLAPNTTSSTLISLYRLAPSTVTKYVTFQLSYKDNFADITHSLPINKGIVGKV